MLRDQGKDAYKAGALSEAAKAFEEARAQFFAQGDVANAASVANDLGVVYYAAGRRDEARQVLQDALATFEKLGNVAGQAKAVGNLAHVMNRVGDKDNAEKYYQRAAELFHQVGDRGLEYNTYRVLSQMQLQRGRWLEAIAAFDRALAAKGGWGALRWLLQIPLRLLGG
jgi:tetratricopeptide (TPR) repeat protein